SVRPVDFFNFVSFFNGLLGGYLESQPPEPVFFFRHIAAVGAIYGFRDGAYFDDRHETEEQYQPALAGLEEEAVRQGGDEIPPIWEAEKDDILDYQGFSRFETGLIRRGEARILLRQLVHRFGDAARILEGVLERSSAPQLVDLSEIALEAKVLDEVLVFCQAHLQLDRATSAEAIGSDVSEASDAE
ncbi:MAG: hypothetical protein GY835_22260, partial [bacterium]|nr:hypothetical protein [bacterium]